MINWYNINNSYFHESRTFNITSDFFSPLLLFFFSPTRRVEWSRLLWPPSILAAVPKVICPIHSYHLVVNWSITPAPYSLNGSVINYHHLQCRQKEKVEKRRGKVSLWILYSFAFCLWDLGFISWSPKSTTYRWVRVNMNTESAHCSWLATEPELKLWAWFVSQ